MGLRVSAEAEPCVLSGRCAAVHARWEPGFARFRLGLQVREANAYEEIGIRPESVPRE